MDGRVQGDKCEDVRSSPGEAEPFAAPAKLSPLELLIEKDRNRELLLEDWIRTYQAQDLDDAIIVVLAADAMARIRELWRAETNARESAIRKAEKEWDVLRAAEASKLCEKLSDHPDTIKPRLEANLHATRWMISLWRALISRLEKKKLPWTDEHRKLALDLLGVPLTVRDCDTPIDSDPDVDPSPKHLEVARAEVKRLLELIESTLEPMDNRERERMLDPYNPSQDRDVHRIFRTVQVLNRRVLTSVGKLRHLAKANREKDRSRFSGSNQSDTNPNESARPINPNPPPTTTGVAHRPGPEASANDSRNDLLTNEETPPPGPEVHTATHAPNEPTNQPHLTSANPDATPETADLTPNSSDPASESSPQVEDSAPDPNHTEIAACEEQATPSPEDTSEPEDKSCEPIAPGHAPRWFCDGMLGQRDAAVQHMNDIFDAMRQDAYKQAIMEGATAEQIKSLCEQLGIAPPPETATRVPRKAPPNPEFPFDELLDDPPAPPAAETGPDPPP